MSNLTTNVKANSFSFLIGVANLPIATNSSSSLYKPIDVTYGANAEWVASPINSVPIS